MQVKCRHCGGENAVHPGQRMLFCSFCGSALVIERSEGPEHLILPHKRNDRSAGDALGSYLLSKGRGRPEVTKVVFAFTPYLLVEDEQGDTDLTPATGSADVSVPYPPAGNYRFFDESLAEGERIIPLDGSDDGREGEIPSDEMRDASSGGARSGTRGERSASKNCTAKTVKILHLPIYTIEYKCNRFKGRASIVGGSWQVRLSDLPAEGPAELEPKNLLILAVLFTVFLFIGKVGSGWAMRFIYIFLSAAAGFAFFRFRERVVSRS
jgi:hypothetical protein